MSRLEGQSEEDARNEMQQTEGEYYDDEREEELRLKEECDKPDYVDWAKENA